MANDLNNGASKLKERILEAARADAAAVAAKAQEDCAEIAAKAQRQMEQNEQQYTKAQEEAVKAILERSRTNAELTARKEGLASRRALMDQAFDEAYRALCGQSGAERAALCKRLLLQEAEGGETVLAAKADYAALEPLVKEVSGQLKAPLQIAEADTDVEYGFVLKGAGFEKDCSFAALLRDARALEETGVANILFD